MSSPPIDRKTPALAARLRQLWPSGADKPPARGKGLGTFLGVFTPTVLTIIGVIMYMRFGWVVGNLGLTQTLLVVAMANSITLITALSFSAMATNTRVGVGGAYFIISRSLGLEIGGAIGLPLFLSQVFSVTLYAFGLAESFRILWSGLPLQPATLVIIVGVAALAFKGAKLALKSQLPIMGLIVLSLAALAAGVAWGERPAAELVLPADVSFWAVFAVFFPAVTGVMAGLGLSGDLRDPSRSIPRGALGATLVGFAIYLTVPVLLVLGADGETLRNDPLVWTRIAPLGALLVLPGLWGAIFSSAVGSMLNAPRTLQALATDHLAPRRLAETERQGGEPKVGLIVTLVIALGAVFLGDLNSVAVVVTIFFLTVYGMVNLVAALETLSGDTSWRPRIRVPGLVSLAGALGCFGVMFLISPIASGVAIGVEVLLWLLLQRKKHSADWGDARRDFYEALIRWALLRLARRPMTARNWRPHVLVFTEQLERELDLVRFAYGFSQGHGVLTVARLVVGDLLDDQLALQRQTQGMQRVLDQAGLSAFAEVNVVRSVEEGIIDVAQANGMAGLESNTVLLGWPNDRGKLVEQLRVMRRLERLNKSVVIGRARGSAFPREGQRRLIDVWWGGLQRNGDLMLLFAHLLTRSPLWRAGRIRVLSLASNELMQKETERSLARLLDESRIDAEVRVLLKAKEQGLKEIIAEQSGAAEAVLLGLATPAAGEEEAYAGRLVELVERLPTFFLVKNASLFVGELVGAPPTSAGPALPTTDAPPAP